MHSTETILQPQFTAVTPQAEEKDEVSLLDLLIVIARRRKFIVLFTCIVTVLALLISLPLPVVYTASTVILPPQNNSAGSTVLSQLGSLGPAAMLASGGGFGLKNPNDTYIALFNSRTVQEAMVRRFGLTQEYHARTMTAAIKAFNAHAGVASGTKDSLITIFVNDRDPKRAADMANGYVEEYRKFSATLAISEASQRRLFFESQLQQAKDNLANAEEALKKTEQTTGLVQIDSQAKALIESAAQLRAQIAAKQVEIRGMREFASDENPDLRLAEQQLAGWQAQLSTLGGSQSGSGDDLMLAKGQVPGAGLEYMRKLRDVKYYDTIFDLLAKQFEVAKLDEARQGSTIQVVDPATPPEIKSAPRRILIVFIAMISGLCISLVWVLVANSFAKIGSRPENRQRLHTLRALLRKS